MTVVVPAYGNRAWRALHDDNSYAEEWRQSYEDLYAVLGLHYRPSRARYGRYKQCPGCGRKIRASSRRCVECYTTLRQAGDLLLAGAEIAGCRQGHLAVQYRGMGADGSRIA